MLRAEETHWAGYSSTPVSCGGETDRGQWRAGSRELDPIEADAMSYCVQDSCYMILHSGLEINAIVWFIIIYYIHEHAYNFFRIENVFQIL